MVMRRVFSYCNAIFTYFDDVLKGKIAGWGEVEKEKPIVREIGDCFSNCVKLGSDWEGRRTVLAPD